MKRVCVLILYASIFCFNSEANSQYDSTSKGIHFESAANWQTIIEKAKAENKIIFVDCYTTWCAPCKVMEKTIYPLEDVGRFFNEHFISVKVQMDQTSKDNDLVKSWYQDAKKIESKYNIDAYPTYLFLSPDGKPLHRASGGFPKDKFISLASDALNPETQSYTLALRYDPAKMDTADMKKVAVSLRRSAPELAAKIALAYAEKVGANNISKKENVDFLKLFYSSEEMKKFVNSYLRKQSSQILLEPSMIDLAITFLNTSKDPGFSFLLRNTVKIDSIKNDGREYKIWFSKKYIDDIIFKEDVQPIIDESKESKREPDWNMLFVTLQKKYKKDYADRLTIEAKMSWFGSQKDYENYCRYLIRYMERYGKEMEFDFGYNNNAWTIFQYSRDPAKLEIALTWSNHAILLNPSANWMDTYANILYKLGRKAQAIRWEQVSAKLDPNDEGIQANLNKMKNDEPTWALH